MSKVDTSEVEFPPIIATVTDTMFQPLREHMGEGKLDDTEINLSRTVGSAAMIVEVTPPGCKTVYVHYQLGPIVEEVARLITDAPRLDA